MIVSYYCCHGFADDSGLFCSDCKKSFHAKFSFFVDHDFKPVKDIFCPYCGKHSLYPKIDIDLAYQNYLKYKEFI